MNFVSLREYEKIRNKINIFITKVANYFNISLEELRYYHYIQYCKQVLNFYFTSFSFKSRLNNLLLGNTIKYDGLVIISTNKNILVTRQVFTTMHEIIHGVFHIEYSNSFADVLDKKQYNNDDIKYEIEADIGASLLIANDNVIISMLDNKLSFNAMKEALYCSANALTIRLINFLIYNYYISKEKAIKIVNKFRYKNRLIFNIHKSYKLFFKEM